MKFILNGIIVSRWFTYTVCFKSFKNSTCFYENHSLDINRDFNIFQENVKTIKNNLNITFLEKVLTERIRFYTEYLISTGIRKKVSGEKIPEKMSIG